VGKSLERRQKAGDGFLRKRRSETGYGKRYFGPLERRKALKGEAQERWELKEASEGFWG
jgi:type IV secretory pathway protease TraF